MARVYGYVHSSAEALQMARYLKGQLDLPTEEGLCIFRPSFRHDPERPVSRADLYLVEISSAKRIHFEGRFLQINYLYRQLDDFFSDPERTRRYWSLSRPGREEQRQAFLHDDPVFQAYPAQYRTLLSTLTLSTATPEETASDMRGIADLLGRDKVIFVTHVNAALPGGDTLVAREALIHDVERVADELGVSCLNPTEAMLDYGQSLALTRGGLDLTHYTEAFSDHLWRHWHTRHLAVWLGPVDAEASAATAAGGLLYDLIETYGRGRLDEVRRRMAGLPPGVLDTPGMRQLRAQIAGSMHRHDEALALIRESERETGPSAVGTRILMQAMAARGEWAASAHLAAGLLLDEIEDPEVLTLAAAAHRHLGLHGKAVVLGRTGLRTEPADAPLLKLVMQSLARAGHLQDFEETFALGDEAGVTDWLGLALATAVARQNVHWTARIMRTWLNRDATAALDWLGRQDITPALVPACSAVNAAMDDWKRRVTATAGQLASAAASSLESDRPQAFGPACARALAAEALGAPALRPRIARRWKHSVDESIHNRDPDALRALMSAAPFLGRDHTAPVWRCVQAIAEAGDPAFALDALIRLERDACMDATLRFRGLRWALRSDQPDLIVRAISHLWPEDPGPHTDAFDGLSRLVTARGPRWVRQLLQAGPIDPAWHLAGLLERVDVPTADKARTMVISAYWRAFRALPADDGAAASQLVRGAAAMLTARDLHLVKTTRALGATDQLATLWWRHITTAEVGEDQVRRAVRVFETAWPADKIVERLHSLSDADLGATPSSPLRRLLVRATRSCPPDLRERPARNGIDPAPDAQAPPPEQGERPEAAGTPTFERLLAELDEAVCAGAEADILALAETIGATRVALSERVAALQRPWLDALQALPASTADGVLTSRQAGLIELAEAAEALHPCPEARAALQRAKRLRSGLARVMHDKPAASIPPGLLADWIESGAASRAARIERVQQAARQAPLHQLAARMGSIIDGLSARPWLRDACIDAFAEALGRGAAWHGLPALIDRKTQPPADATAAGPEAMLEPLLSRLHGLHDLPGLFHALDACRGRAVWRDQWLGKLAVAVEQALTGSPSRALPLAALAMLALAVPPALAERAQRVLSERFRHSNPELAWIYARMSATLPPPTDVCSVRLDTRTPAPETMA